MESHPRNALRSTVTTTGWADGHIFISMHALAQVLPVYLRSLVEEGFWSPALETMLGILARPARIRARERFDAFAAALTSAQRGVIRVALQHLADQGPHEPPGSRALAALAGWDEGG